MQSVMSHSFGIAPESRIPRSSFDRSHGYKTTLNAGYLVPVFVDWALPGDIFKLNMNVFCRLATPIVPIMDNMFMDSFFFAVPYRLVWNNFQKFMGERVDPDDSTDYLLPVMDAAWTQPPQSLADYFGIPTSIATGSDISSLPFRAYNLIWNEWFRDENLQDSRTVLKTDGPDPIANYPLARRNKRHDYFTSCLPWPQKGPAVPIPIGSEAPIRGYGGSSPSLTDAVYLKNNAGTTPHTMTGSAASTTMQTNATVGNTNNLKWQQPGDFTAGLNNQVGYNFADLTGDAAGTINALRMAFQMQELFEIDARGGTRYTEINRAHFGVISPDARLQRPEFLGGGTLSVNINPIAQTSSTDATTPQGNLAAMGVVSGNAHGFTKSFTEHTIIIGMVSVRADLNYQNNLNRQWSYRTRYDMFWPSLANVGEQAVLSKEIYYDAIDGNNDDVFGFCPRYDELRFKPSQITGKFRSGVSGSLDFWHLAQDFSSRPTLSSSFISEEPPVDRVIATPEEPQFLFDSYFNFNCVRPMPMYSVPRSLGRF